MANRILTIDTSVLKQAITASSSIRQVFLALGFDTTRHNYRVFRQRTDREGIDCQALFAGTNCNKGQQGKKAKVKTPMSEILIEKSHFNRGHLKIRLSEEGYLIEKCAECGNGAKWNGKPLSLQLDHTNGLNTDNRIENLRLLCPNCHSQTDTFSKRRIRGKEFAAVAKAA